MLSRRIFLNGLAGAAFAAPKQPCTLPWGCTLKPSQLSVPKNGPIFRPPHRKPRPRPLLSELAPDDPVFKKLQIAYDKLRDRSVRNCVDPRGLLNWAWLHNYNCDSGPENVHANWYFLPWHRAFLYFHERALQRIVGHDFQLPIWDWEKCDEVPDFYMNWLPGIGCTQDEKNLGRKVTGCSLQGWLLSQSKEDFLGKSNGHGNSTAGPHSYVHSHIGGILTCPATAAGDPLFYAHHGNVDRFWQYWRGVYGQAPPFNDEDVWKNRLFDLYDENGKPVRIAVKDLLDPEKLGYEFDYAKLPARDLLYKYNPLQEFEPDASNLAITLAKETLLVLLDLLRLTTETKWRLDAFRAAIAHAEGLVDKVQSLTIDFVKSLDDAAKKIEVPVRIEATPPDAKPGQYYFVGMREASDHKQTPVPIGGFGIFANPGSHHAEHRHVIAMCCFGAEALTWLVTWNGKVRFVYAPPAANGVDLDITQEKPLWPLSKVEFLTRKT